MKITTFIVDDSEIFRLGLQGELKAKLADIVEVVGEAVNGQEAVESICRLAPDVVLMDIEMPKMDGIAATKIIHKKVPTAKVIGISNTNNSSIVLDMISAGADGFLLTNTTANELKTAITTVYNGGSYYTPEVSKHLIRRVEELSAKNVASRFSDKEKMIITLICSGLNNKQIADKLGYTKRTIDSYREQIMKKMEGKGCADLINFALKAGIHTPQ